MLFHLSKCDHITFTRKQKTLPFADYKRYEGTFIKDIDQSPCHKAAHDVWHASSSSTSA